MVQGGELGANLFCGESAGGAGGFQLMGAVEFEGAIESARDSFYFRQRLGANAADFAPGFGDGFDFCEGGLGSAGGSPVVFGGSPKTRSSDFSGVEFTETRIRRDAGFGTRDGSAPMNNSSLNALLTPHRLRDEPPGTPDSFAPRRVRATAHSRAKTAHPVRDNLC